MTDRLHRSAFTGKDLSPVSSQEIAEADVIITAALSSRPARSPDLAAENQALRTLAQQLTDAPQSMLKTIVGMVLNLCACDTVGVSLLETGPNGESLFRTVALAGALEVLTQTTTPGNFSPCGTTLSCNQSQLYTYPERYFTYLHHPQFPIVEELVMPLSFRDRPLGTLWMMSHDEARRFDAEDRRLMMAIGGFAASALQALQQSQQTIATALCQSDELNQQILNSSDDCIKVLDLEGRILFMSAGGQARLSIQDLTPFLNTSWVQFWQGADRQAAIEAIAKARAGGNFTFQGYRPTLSGEPKWWDSKVSPIRGANGYVERLLCISRDITKRKRSEDKRKQAQQRLRKSEAQLSAIFSQAAVGLCEISLDGHFQRVNDQLCRIVGRSREQILATSVPDITHPEDVIKSLEALKQLIETGKPVSFDKRYLRSDGKIVWANSSLTRLDDEQGHPRAVLAVTVDLSARKQAEEISRRAAELDAFRVCFADALRPLADPVEIQATSCRILGEYLDANRIAYFEVRGTDYVVERDYVNGAEALTGAYPVDSFGPKLLAAYCTGCAVSADDVQADPSLSPQERAAYAARQIGAYIGIPLVKGGEFVAGLAVHTSGPRAWTADEVALTQEVAERTWATVERARAESALRQSEQRFRLMADAVPQIVWLTNAEGQVEFFNKQWSDYTGVPYEPTMAAEVAASFIHPDDRDSTMEAFNQARCSGSIFSVEHRIRSAAGIYRWFLVRAEPYREPQTGKIVRWFGASVDIDDRKRMEANFAFLAEIVADFAPLNTTDEIMHTACAKTAAYFDLSRCLLVEISDAMDEAEIVYDFATDDLPRLIGTYRIADFHTEDEVQELAAGRAIAINDVAAVPRTAQAADRFTGLQIGALVNASYVSDGQWKFVLSAMQTKPRVWRMDEIELLQELSARVWLRIERARIESALRESEAKYRSLFSSMDEGFCILQLLFDEEQKPVDYRYIEINPAFEKQTGMKNALGRTIRELVPEIEEFWFDIYGKVALTGEPTRFVDCAESMGRWFDVNAFRVGAAHERKVAVLFNNISERKQAEAAIAADLRDTQLLRDLSARLLAESNIQVLYNEILAAAIALMQADAGSFQFLDRATQETLLLATQGFSPAMAKHFDRIDTSFNTSCGIALASGKRAIVDFDVPQSDDDSGHRRMHVDAGYFSAQSTPLISRSGKLLGMVSTHWRRHYRPSERELRFLDLLARQAADLIEQRQAEVERQQILKQEQVARQEAERANRLKDEFLAVLSHELRSPLNPILGWSKLLQSSKLSETKTRQALSTIERNARLQSELIEDLLDVSRVLRGQLSLNAAPVNLVSIIRAAMETVRLAAEAKSIQLEASLEPDVGLVSGDSTRLQQVICNLLSNAVKFTPQAGQVNIRLQRLDWYAQITVSDTGQGIAPDFLPYVFDYFRQADATSTRKFGGLGLGLAIVRHLVELHGGTVEAKSPGEGQGATFIVRLPSQPTASIAYQDELTQAPSLDLNDIKILVVDDETDTREFVTFLLEQSGAKVTAVSSAHEALLVLTQFQPDVLLSDIGMPDINGYMLLQQVRALLPHGKQIRAIALTAYAGDIDRKQVIAAGFQKHICKPIEPQVLVEEIALLVRST